MLKCTRLVPRSAMAVHAVIDEITLARSERHRRRIVLRSDGGRELLLDLPEAAYLGDGDGLLVEGHGVVLVRAAAEDLLEVRAPDPRALARIAWHIGNRHTPCEIADGALYIQPDHVLSEMVEGLGGSIRHLRRPFDPEGGAYGTKGPLGGGHHHHGHHHHDDHEHRPPNGGSRR